MSRNVQCLKALAVIICVTTMIAVLDQDAHALAGVTIQKEDAVVWSQDVVIRGQADSAIAAPGGVLFLNGVSQAFTFLPSSKMFEVPLHLSEGVNVIVARCDDGRGGVGVSDTLRLTLGYRLLPELFASADVHARTVTLQAAVLENPKGSRLTFHWSADEKNPSRLDLIQNAETTAVCTIPGGAPMGEYYFTLRAVTAEAETVAARTFVTLDSMGIRPFAIKTDHAGWIDTSVIYEITPSIFVGDGTYGDITEKLPELRTLGVNTVWLQPVYETHGGGMGYDVTNFFALRADLGSEAALRTLIARAHTLGMHVVFDFVPNHSSIYHPYALESAREGTRSHYYEYYQREFDSAPYSSNYHRYQGFVNYFWNELPNFNYDNPEVGKMITEAAKYWVKKFDIDGYRVDVAWGVTARKPEFTKQFRLTLKRLKPELLLLGEDKATLSSTFDERFDAAFDWTPEETWISHWVWQTSYSTSSNPTIFNNGSASTRAALLRASLTNSGSGYAPGATVLHFMENNDTFRFLATHDLARTKMVAALMFALPGIPLLYNGQEIGAATHPYSAYEIFYQPSTIRSRDKYGLFAWYQHLIAMRMKYYHALTGREFEEVPLGAQANGAVFAFRRWHAREQIVGVINMGAADVSAQLALPVSRLGIDSSRTYYFTDLLTGLVVPSSVPAMALLTVSMPAYSTRIFLLDTIEARPVVVPDEEIAVAPKEFALNQNYPNPFNPSTTISYSLPQRSDVTLTIYDALGRETAVLVRSEEDQGVHRVDFTAHGRLASGVYFYRLKANGFQSTKKMMLLK